jgi:hypothetical protein
MDVQVTSCLSPENRQDMRFQIQISFKGGAVMCQFCQIDIIEKLRKEAGDGA